MAGAKRDVSDTKKLLLIGVSISLGLMGFFLLYGWFYDVSQHSWIVILVFSGVGSVANWMLWRRVDRKGNWKKDLIEPDENDRLINLFPPK